MRNIWNIGSNELFFFSIGKVILIGIFITLIFLSSTIEDLLDECSSYKLVYQIDNIKDKAECKNYIDNNISKDEDVCTEIKYIKKFESSINIFKDKIWLCKKFIIVSLVLVIPSTIFSVIMDFCRECHAISCPCYFCEYCEGLVLY